MKWINKKANGLKQGAIRAMFDRANTITGVISMASGEALEQGLARYTPDAGLPLLRKSIARIASFRDGLCNA